MKPEIVDYRKVYTSKTGAEREKFCLELIKSKQNSFRRIESEIFGLTKSRHEKITCHKGCSACCVLYIEANIQECETIVYYLYHNPGVLKLFLGRYEGWRRRMKMLGGTFSVTEGILNGRCENLTPSDQQALLDVLRRYQEQEISCAFLDEGACSIYDVRPYVCANHYVTTPEEWCKAENQCNPVFANRPKTYMTEIEEINDRSFYLNNLDRPLIGFMPTMVYRILTEGLDYIRSISR